MKEILIAVKNKIAMNLGNATYVCDNSDYRVVFEFDEEWQEHPVKTARFKYNGTYQEVVFSGSVCNMPVIRDASLIYIGVYAGNLQTSTPAVVHASHSILSGDAAHDAPAEDVYNQLVALVESGVLKGPTGPKGDTGAQGPQGEKGEKGDPGLDGADGKDGTPGAPGKDGIDGKDGAPGRDGSDGHTPEYGVDYGTPEQISGIAQQAAEILQPEVNQLKQDLENYTKNIGLYGESYNIVDLTKITNGYYIKPDGSVNSNASYSYTDFIPVTEGDVIVSWKWSGSRWVENIESIRFIAAYDSNKSVISDSGAEKQFEYVVPSGVSYIILSCNTNNLENKTLMILRNYTQTPSEYIVYVQAEYKGKASFISPDMASEIEDISFGKTQSIRRCRGGFIASGDLSEDIVFPNNSVNGRYRIVVNAKITALGTIAIGRKHGSTSYGYFEIDGSEIRWYSTGTTLTKTYTHGLTIGKECAIIIETNPSPASAYRQYEHRVTVVSGGQSYATENIVIQNFSKGKTCYIHADNSTLSVDASFTFYNAKSPVYAFGDSYFTWGPARWTGYLYDDGFADNVLTDAYSGRGSTDALESFKNLECVGIPSYVLWCMGMNDADTAESVNSNWKTAYDYVCDYCDNHHIELILATIPEVTNDSYRNDKKNSIVRNSGRRYVDFAKAVNAETVGSAWYDGMLASDGVHPTESGARTLYNQILVDFPEIMLFN